MSIPGSVNLNQSNLYTLRKPWLTLIFSIGLLAAGGVITYAVMQFILPGTGDATTQLAAQADVLPLPPKPPKMPAPSLDEVQLAATIMTNAAERPEAAQHIQLVYSLRNQQQLTKLAQLQAEQAQAQADIVRSQSEQQKLLAPAADEASQTSANQARPNKGIAQAIEPKPLETLLLSAIVVTPQGDHKATIGYDGRRYTVRQGNTIASDILVEQLSHDTITLSRAGKRLKLYLN